MAEKKFFVDINLQGSALTNAKIGTNTGIGSTEGAFGYDSTAHRLQYFDGTATKDVANLSDVAAVTGGLIFQGGYDPTTNTPDITDGTALKGFFWAATAAGTFLGESVQVGDSIVAKVDNAGATIADWLILQGNVVIATDSVDGISRLATQTEANDGTEGGAVVITPATLQGKIDAQITPEINDKLSKQGGAMTGALDMYDDINMHNNGLKNVNSLSISSFQAIAVTDAGSLSLFDNKITDLAAPTNDGDAANKLYVDNASNDKLPLAGGTMSGALVMNGSELLEATISNSALGSDLNANDNKITNLLAPTEGGDATNKTYVDGQVATSLPLAGGTMSGSIDMGTNSISNAVLSNGSLGNEFNAVNNKITNLGAPTNEGDAANKGYVDGAASTAQANAEATAQAYADSLAPNYDAAGSAAQALTDANDYTDGKFNTNSYAKTLLVANWVAQSDYYLQDVTHNLNSNWLNISAFDLSDSTLCELQVVKIDQNTSRVYVNQIPTDNIGIALSRVNPEV